RRDAAPTGTPFPHGAADSPTPIRLRAKGWPRRLRGNSKFEVFTMFNWVDRIPTGPVVFAAIVLGLAPFVPEPHLWQKLKMLMAGTLSKPLDIFDLFMHSIGLILLGFKGIRYLQTGSIHGNRAPGDQPELPKND
ncbi:MAG: hypothetical protein ACPGU7_11900, partial [Gammaproteobacteria bacterium]